MATDYSGDFAAVVCVITVLTYLLYRLCNASFYLVSHAEVMIIERFGRFESVLKPGFHWVWPIIQTPRFVQWRYRDAPWNGAKTQVVAITTNRIDMREHVIDLGKQTVITRDTVQIVIDALVYFRIEDAQRAVYSVQNLPDAIELLVQATLRNIVAGLTLDDTFSSREQINAELLGKVQRDAERWGVTITRVEVFNISPPPDIQGAMENQIKAERERRSEVLRADGQREASVITSRGQAAQIVLGAEASRAAAVLRARGGADARRVMAAAEAQCLGDIREAVAPHGRRATDYLTVVEYMNSLATLTASGPQAATGDGNARSPRPNGSDKVVLVPNDAVDVMSHVLSMAQDGPAPAAGGGAARAALA